MKPIFMQARPVWGTELKSEFNQFLGFYTEIKSEKGKLTILIAARSYYRLYINGQIVANGPARCAKHYCRVDVLNIDNEKNTGSEEKLSVAIEVTALDKPEKYCNDNTLESGLLAAEIQDEEGNILASTGENGQFRYQELHIRRADVETMSHSRGIVEWYDLTPTSYDWIWGKGDWKQPQELEEKVTFLERRASYASLNPIRIAHFSGIYDMIDTGNATPGFVLTIAEMFNPDWYRDIPKENRFLLGLRGLKEQVFTGKYKIEKKLSIEPGEYPTGVVFEHPVSELGFVDFEIKVEKETLLDLINTDHLSYEGDLRANTYVTRYHLAPGEYHLTTFEPKLVRYLRFILRTEGKVSLSFPQILDYAYPDNGDCLFVTDDGDLNRIYEGARRTLRLSTLDIFMDCPQRERGGWLCDSTFAAEAMWQVFGDLSTERDFLENFMLTENMWNGFFPEVYPGSKKDETDPGFVNWSYWLMLELCDYYERSGDREFIEKSRNRVVEFVQGLLSLRKEHGLIETGRGEFVDWSLANRDFALKPVSVSNNCLAVYMLEKLGKLYDCTEWIETASEIRNIIERLDSTSGIFGGGGDGAVYINGELKRNDCPSEGGHALELYSGFHRKDKLYVRQFLKTMGPCPEFRADPNVAKANLFIGLMIRFVVIAELDETEVLVRELKDVYLEQLRVGSGTFFENINAISGCHGFNGMAAALLKEKMLGLGQPIEKDKTVLFKPNPCHLRWAEGTSRCSDGMILCRWQADHEEHQLKVILQIPEGWTMRFERVFALTGWIVRINDEVEE